MSATQPPDEGLVALPNMPFNIRAEISRIKRRLPVSKPLCPREMVKLNRTKETAKPSKPITTILFLPTESLNDPHIGLNIIHARADVANIEPI